MQIFLILCVVISFICVTGNFIATYKLSAELNNIKGHLELLNQRVNVLTEKCQNDITNKLSNNNMENNDSIEYIENISPEPRSLHEFNETDYDYFSEEGFRTTSRLRRANQRKGNKRRVVKSSGIFYFIFPLFLADKNIMCFFTGSLAAHFKGSVPEIVIEDQGGYLVLFSYLLS